MTYTHEPNPGYATHTGNTLDGTYALEVVDEKVAPGQSGELTERRQNRPREDVFVNPGLWRVRVARTNVAQSFI